MLEAEGSPRAVGSWRGFARRFASHRRAMLSLALLTVVVLGTIFGGWLWPYDHTQITNDLSSPPSWKHPMGTDGLGRDLYAQVLRGTQKSLEVGVLVAALSTAVGTLIGAAAGYYGRWVDSVLMRLTDVVLAVPAIALLAVLARSVQSSSGSWMAIALLLSLFSWTGIARVVRSIMLQLRESEFVAAAQATGASSGRILFLHLLPHTTGVIVVKASLAVSGAILAETTLSYLGLGIGPPDISLGRLVDAGQQSASNRPWLFYFPGLAILAMVLTINFVGDGIRDSLDPRYAASRTVRRRSRKRPTSPSGSA